VIKTEKISKDNYVLEDQIGFVSLIQYTGDDIGVVNSARVSFGQRIEELAERDEKLISFLLRNQHGTPFEHNSLTYLVKCPIFVARQWHRHRVGISINEISARYVEVREEFYIPQSFRRQSTSNRQASIDEHLPKPSTDSLHIQLKENLKQTYELYQKLIREGVSREQARSILPLSCYTQFYWTCNLRSLMHFVKLRDHEDAQWEIRQYAKAMLNQAQEIFPISLKIWKDLGRP